MNRLYLFVALLMMLLMGEACGQIPNVLYYENFYEPDGNISLVIRIYTNETGGDCLYEESNNVTVANGAFWMLIGTNGPVGTLTNALASGRAFLDVTINGTNNLQREQILPQAYALQAAAVSSNAITASMIANNAIQSRHLAVTGTLHATSFVGDGSGLTGIQETDPIWNAEKSDYATGTPLYVESDTLQSVTDRGGFTTGELKRITFGYVTSTNDIDIVVNGRPTDLSGWDTNIPPPGAGNYYPWAVQPANGRFWYNGYNSNAKLVQYTSLVSGQTYRLSMDNLTMTERGSLTFGVLNGAQLTDFNTGGAHVTYEWVQSAPADGFWFGVHAHMSPGYQISFSNISIHTSEIIPATFTNSYLTDVIGDGSDLTNLTLANIPAHATADSTTNYVRLVGNSANIVPTITSVISNSGSHGFQRVVSAGSATAIVMGGEGNDQDVKVGSGAPYVRLAMSGSLGMQRGYALSTGANVWATNSGSASIGLFYLSGSAYSQLIAGNASIGCGAVIVTNNESVAVGNGTVSHGDGSISALSFWGNGSGLTNLNISSDTNYVRRTGDTMTGPLSVAGAIVATNSYVRSHDSSYSKYSQVASAGPMGGRVEFGNTGGVVVLNCDTSIQGFRFRNPVNMGTNYITNAVYYGDGSGITNLALANVPGYSTADPTTNYVRRTGDVMSGNLAVGTIDAIYLRDAVNEPSFGLKTVTGGPNKFGVFSLGWNGTSTVFMGTGGGLAITGPKLLGDGSGLNNISLANIPAYATADPTTNSVRRTGDAMTGTLTLNAATALSTTGNVGIGTTPTTNKLEVAGAAQMTAIRVTGTSGSYIERQGDISMGTFTNGL